MFVCAKLTQVIYFKNITVELVGLRTTISLPKKISKCCIIKCAKLSQGISFKNISVELVGLLLIENEL